MMFGFFKSKKKCDAEAKRKARMAAIQREKEETRSLMDTLEMHVTEVNGIVRKKLPHKLNGKTNVETS